MLGHGSTDATSTLDSENLQGLYHEDLNQNPYSTGTEGNTPYVMHEAISSFLVDNLPLLSFRSCFGEKPLRCW